MLKENQMLQRITKFFNKKEDTEMSKDAEAVKVDASDVKAEVEKLQTDFEAFKTEANALIAQADAEKAELKKQVEALVAEKASMVAEQKTKQLAARKVQVEAAVGTEKAAALLSATENMEDAQFNAVISALAGSIDTEAQSAMFKDVGVDAQVDASKVVEGGLMKALQEKYQAK